MIGVAAEESLVRACEQRLGEEVRVASTFDLRRFTSPAGCLKRRKPERVAVALTGEHVWLLEFRYWVVGFSIGAALGHLPRAGLVAQWHRRWWGWPTVWKLELSWPAIATYVEGSLVSCPDTDRLMGLLAADELLCPASRRAPRTV